MRPKRRTRLQQWELAQAMRTFERVRANGAKRPTGGLPGLAVFVISGLLLAVQVGLIVLAVAILVVSDAPVFSLLFAVPLFVAGLLPVFILLRRDRSSVPAPPTEFPQLYDLVRRIAAAEEAPMVRRIHWDARFNASASRRLSGPTLTIGMPLWLALRPTERVAVLAHEMAHFRNGDPRRGWMVGLAMTQLGEWHRAMAGLRGFEGVVAAVLAIPVRLAADVLERLSYSTSQRAEYYADLVAASVASTDAMVDSLAVSDSGLTTVAGAFQRAAREQADVWPILRAAFAGLPETERERRRRAAAQDDELDSESTHPPTGHRITVLRLHPEAGDRSLLSAAVGDDPGLAAVQVQLSRMLRDGRRP